MCLYVVRDATNFKTLYCIMYLMVLVANVNDCATEMAYVVTLNVLFSYVGT
jgi:hypothetical protein